MYYLIITALNIINISLLVYNFYRSKQLQTIKMDSIGRNIMESGLGMM